MAIPFLLFGIGEADAVPPEPLPDWSPPSVVVQRRSLGITVAYADPLWLPARRGYIDTLTDRFESYGHTISAFIGYDTADFSMNIKLGDAEEWVDGLGRYVETVDDTLTQAWEGFVNKITIRAGAKTLTIGPLLDIINYGWGVYSTIDTSVDPPILGEREVTAVVQDATSQSKYGVLHGVLSLGGSTSAEAVRAVTRFLSESKFPEQSGDDNLGSVGQVQVQADCLGFGHLLNSYVPSFSGTGQENVSLHIQKVINASPNAASGIYSSDFSQLTTNTFQVGVAEKNDKKAITLIEDAVGLGDASDNRYLFGFYNNRQVYYAPAPSAVEYQYTIGDNLQIIELVGGGDHMPWNVRPGKWIMSTDFLVGRSAPANLREDFRARFIESTTYKAPWSLRVKGGRNDEMPQLLAKIRMGGAVT